MIFNELLIVLTMDNWRKPLFLLPFFCREKKEFFTREAVPLLQASIYCMSGKWDRFERQGFALLRKLDQARPTLKCEKIRLFYRKYDRIQTVEQTSFRTTLC